VEQDAEWERDQNAQIDGKRVLRWLVNQQGSKIELGGFRGRTNKLVDACYSWWVGGAFNLLCALGIKHRPSNKAHVPVEHQPEKEETTEIDGDDPWADVDEALFDRLGLQQYIICAAQHDAGGLRDKPPKHPDSYHTLYSLAGLGAAQHHMYQPSETLTKLKESWKTQSDDQQNELHKIIYCEALAWTEEEGSSKYLYTAGDRINAPHPVLVLTTTHVKAIMDHFYHQA